MVLLKRAFDNRFNDHNSPTVPKAPRSIRRRSNHKPPQTGSVCAFELLAAVAGKLLQESECSSASSSAVVGFDQCRIDIDSIKKAQQDDQGSSEGTITSSACSMKLDFGSNHKNPCDFVILSDIREESPPKCREADDTNVEKGNNKNPALSGETSGGDCTMTNKYVASTKCKDKVELPLFSDSNPDATFHKLGNNVNIGCKDDDESVSLDSQPHRKVKVCNSKTDSGDQNTRKLLTSNMLSTAPKLKDYEKCDTGSVKHSSHNKRYPHEMDTSQRNSPFKKRRFLDRSSVVTYGGGISCETVSNSPDKSVKIEKNATVWKLHEGKGTYSSAFGGQKSCNSKSSDVRFRIKSFKVPELFIEVPKNTTVCSLKKTVLEAVTTILGGGLRVGVLLHGKNIQEDEKTLFQTGISQNDDMDSVAFMLEPDSPTQPSQFKCFEDPHVLLSPDSPKFVNRSLDNTITTLMTDSNWPDGSKGDIVPSHSTDVAEKIGSASKALVPLPQSSNENLALMVGNPRPKRGEIGQRRARRPFSVSEVEALVQAVEKLGTGRWRDVKLCAFENAKHRTYVDLKDKWKTLVHTARISPQQRRGEPVPQELLDRVLATQAYWSDHQAKHHGKQQHAIVPKLTDCATVKA